MGLDIIQIWPNFWYQLPDYSRDLDRDSWSDDLINFGLFLFSHLRMSCFVVFKAFTDDNLAFISQFLEPVFILQALKAWSFFCVYSGDFRIDVSELILCDVWFNWIMLLMGLFNLRLSESLIHSLLLMITSPSIQLTAIWDFYRLNLYKILINLL